LYGVPVRPGDFICDVCVEKAETYWIHSTTRMEELIKGVGYTWCSMAVEELFKKRMTEIGGSTSP
jgi:hypothetical protein